ncbi:gliding motility-associated C-terminal domain-containing protein [Algoriphagus halophytocola]|uniref:DUF7507 domain-containing protein n=1 Tax=Algoriphagus halophytocola TaxID=2991499 RepID=UPI0022DD1A2B|nr:gliding motility-associated C-terminal domain-containing protein [Algoriphagus sp. TR-M9]WBL42985.1 gliding motility-associated C-terminal domain-containing protein [Algoriphagus sp. TR-M9]
MDSTSNCQFSARPQQSGFFERATAYRSLKGFLTAGLLLLLFFASGQVAFSQGLGDPIFIEDFGTINDGETQHVFNDTRSGTNGRGVYFKYESLDYITSMDFYTPQRWGTNQFPYQNQYRSSGPSIPGGVSYNTSPAGANNNVQNGNWGPVFANISESNGTGIGGYSITNDSRGYYQPYFAIGTDHTTEDAADYTGYMLLIDAHSSTTLYFDRKIDGLCAGTKFRFSVWIKDMNGQGGEPPKVNFKILNGINDNLITSKATTDDDVDPAGEWKQLYIDFQMPAGVSSVRLQIENIVGTQYGNDLAIDDISFAPLGPPAELIGLDAVCVGEDPGLKARITDADPEFAYSTNYFQLQYREADSPDEWINIGSTLSNSGSSTDYVDFPNPYAQPGSPLDPLTGYEFRVVVAGDPTTLENEFCRVVSPKFINVYRHEVALEAELEEICIGSSTTISAAVSNGIGTPTYTYVWEKEVGGNWEVIPNENSSTLNTGALSESTTYRAKALVNNCPGSGYSDPITVTAVACTATIEKVITNLANIPIVTTPGQTVNYRVTVSNPSSLDLTGVVVTDLLPDGSAGILVQSQGSDDDGILSPSETWVYTISYTANNFDLQNRTELINTATVDSNETEPKSDTASIAILPSVDCENENSSYDFQCNAQDITVSEFYLGDPITGDELESCVAGSSQSAGIWTVFGGANQGGNNERYSLLVKYQLYVNDEFVEDVELELFGSTNIPRGVPIKITDYTWTCGDKIEFKDFFMSWSANQNSWDVSGPRCIKCFTGFVVNAPLVANFEYSGACESTQVAFTDKSTGGDNSNYSYTWTFGNNLGNSNASNPSFDFGNPGTYDVTLEITDGDETTSITKQVTIDEPVTVSGSSNGEVCFGANDGTVSITPDGGDGSYSYSWTGPNSFTSNDQNLTGLSPGTYEVKVTDSKGCFVIEEYIVGAGEQVGLPNTTDKEYCKADEDFYYIVSPTSANYEIVYYTTQVSNDGTTTAPAVDGNNVGDYSVWVSQRNTTSGCESVRKEVEISIIDLPVLVVQSPDPVCGPADIDLADAIDLQGTSQGADFTYYKQGEPGEISSTVSESGTYIIRATIGECYVEEEVEVVINECAIAIIKTVAPTTADDCVEAGDELTYTFVVRNTGTVTLGSVAVAELSFSGTGTAPAITFVAAESDNVEGTLAPGEEATYTATYVVTPADVEAGLITNQARATGQFGQNTPVTDDSGESFEVDGLTEFELCQKESIAIIKTVAPTTADDCVEAGDELTYTFVVRNTGTVTLGNVSVAELSFSGTGTAPAITFVAAESDNVEGTLAPGEEATYTATYVVTPADVEAGLITNQARATGQFGQNTPVTDDSGESFEVDGLTEFELCQKESIAIIKTVAPTTADDCVEAGDELTYTFVVRNTGTVTLGNVSVSELSFSGTGTAPAITFVAAESDNVEGTLAPGEEATYTATYVVTPADVEAGLITNQARATGQFGQNTPVTDDSGESFEVDGLTEFELCQKESIAIIKTVAPTTADDCVEAGDELTYTFVVRNTGTVTLGNVSVSELSFSGTGTAPAITFVAAESDNVEGTLAPGEEATYTATYVVTPADVEAGLITNQARATGQFGQNTPVTDDSGESFEVDGLTEFELCQKESIAIIKTVAPTTADDCVEAGDELTYTFVVRNTGTVTLGNVSVSELSFSGTGTAPAITFVAAESDNVEGTLAPGEEATYTATYVVTPADVEAGLITNQARATGQFGQNTPVTDDSGESFEVDGLTEFELCQKESIAIIKTVAPTTADDCVEAGDELTYTFVVRNTGTVTLGNVSVAELSFSGTGTAPAITFVAAESDNVEGTLAPGEEATYTATYVVTPADVEAGLITNQARATGQFGQNTPVTDDSGESFEVDGLTEFELCQKESIAIIKTVAPTTADDCVEAGDELTYTFVVRNTGTVTLGNVSVSELSFSGTGTAPAITFVAAESDNVEGTLAPGEEATYTATYVVTPADVEAGLITNQARATGQFGQNTPVTDDSGESFEVDGLTEFELCQKESIAIIKTVAPTTADDCVEAGDELTYTFVVRNTGTVTLGNVSVSELSFSGTGTAPAITFVAAESDNVEGTLAPGEEATYTATYVVTPADVEAGLITNQARATGQFGQNTPVTDDSGESFEVDGLTEFELCQKESIAIIKTVAPTTADDCVEAGDELTYTFVVRNTGTVTLGNVSVSELSFSGTGTAPAITFVAAESDNVEGTLAPGEEATYTATYVVTPADVEAGLITNQARATGQFGQNTPVTDDSGESFEVDGLTEFELCQKESIAIIKTVAPTTADDCVEAGDELTYTFVVRNTGTVTLGNVSVSELSFSGTGTAPAITFVAAESDNVEGTLAPGEEETYTATYVVTPADVEAGLITNQARATGQFGQNTPVTDDSGESFEVDGLTEFELCQKESIAIIKTVAPTTADDCVEAGDELTYTFVVRNTGTVTLGNVSVSELSFSGTGTAPAITFVAAESDNVEGTLAPGEEATYTATYVVTPADVEAGLITNQARATGQFGQNTPVTDDSGESFEVDGLTEFELCQKESIAIIKTVAPTTADDCVEAGDELTYTFVVRNTGTVTLGNVSVSELSFSGTGTAPAITFVAAESDNVEGTLAPGEEATYTATYVVTPADVEAGLITNQARATGQFGQNTPVTDDSGESFEVDGLTEFELCQKESIAIIKTVAPTTADDCVEAGDELTYTFVVRNTGTVTLGNVSVSELSFSGTGTAPAITFVAAESDNVEGTLAPGEEATYTATYVVTPADVEAGLITNQARATGQFGQNTPVTDDSGESFEVDGLTEFELCQKESIAIIKTVAPTTADDCVEAGDELTYTFVVRNTGTVTLGNVSVSELSFSGTGTAPAITFVAAESDNVEGTLAPGEEATYTATYVVTPADVEAGLITNQARATGQFGQNTPVTDDSGESFEVDGLTEFELCQKESIAIIKTVAPTTADDCVEAGDELTYTFVVRNTGTVTLGNVSVSELSFSGTGTAPAITFVAAESDNVEGTLAPGEEETYTATYVVTPADVEAGLITNQARATGQFGQNTPVTDDSGESFEVDGLTEFELCQKESIAIIKTVAPTTADDCVEAGDELTYTFVVRNTGTVTLGNVSVSELSFSGTGTAPAITFVAAESDNVEGTLAPGEEATYTATYVVTPADVEAGLITNQARATGQFGQNTPVTDDSGESFEVDGLTEFELCQKAEIAIIKTASVDSEDDCYDTDDLVTYTFTVFNTGNVTLTDVEVTEYHFTGSGDISDITFVESSEDSEEGTLLPGESATYTATYTLTLEDTDARFVNNQALVTALFGENEVDDLSGDTVQDDNETQVDLCQNPGLEITKTVSSNAEILDGDLIFDITVKNTGNVTLYNIYVEDIETEDNWTIDELAPNAEDTRQVTVKITQEMIDGICYENTAIAESREFIDGQQQSPGEGEFPGGLLYRVVAQDEDMADACFPQTPELTIVKEITAGDPYSLVDDVVEYSYTLENTGNVTLYGPFTVEDDKIAGTIVDENSTASMAPGDEIVFTATYAITAADLEEGTVTNTAIGKGFIGEGEGQEPIESDPDSETAEASFNEILAVDDFAGTFDYETTAQTSAVNALTNDELKGGQATPANVTLTTVIADPEGVLSVDANGEITIAPNPQAGNYQLTYRITETGNPSNWDEAVITVTINPELGLIEVDEYCELDAPYLRWLLSPVNFDLQDLAPNDPNPLTMTWYDKDDNVIISYDNIPMEGYMLFPGADTLAGGYGSAWPGWKFENQQWVAGEFNFYQVREDGAYVIFELNPEVQAEIAYPGASAECNPNPNPPIAEDDDMTSIPVYEFGYDDIVNVLTNDRLLDGTSPLNTTLVTVTEVTQSTPGALILDTNTGLVSVASGLTPGVYTLEYRICTNPNPTNCDTALVTVRVVSPGLDIEKEVVENDNEVGGFVTYAIKVTNTGDVELYNIEVKDGLTGEMWTIQSLAPQATWEEETQLEIDQDLIDGLCVTNTASATAYEEGFEQDSEFSEGRILASDEDSIEECFETSPSINLVKTAEVESEDDCYDTGDSVTYTFVITNTGNVTLNSVTLEEVNFTGTGDLSDVNFEGTSMGSSEGTLKPGETATYTASYIITLDDTNARFINNQARATGIFVETEVQDLSGESIDSDVETQVDLCQRPAIELLKDGVFNDENQDGFGNVGETISYTFTVSNTGNVTLSNIMVTDPMVTVNGGPISLAPGASDNTTFTATYVLTQDDIDNGYVVNTALAQGTSPTNEVVEDESSDPTPVENPSTECETCTETEIPQNPAIELLKDGVFNDENQDGFGNVGETISYTFTVSNTGNVTLSNIMVTDPMVTVNGGPISLAPGVSDNTTFTATYVLTQDDIDNGYVVNTALAQGTSPKDEVVEDESSDPTPVENPSTECETCTETEIPQNPAIQIVKSDNGAEVNAAGDVITYTLTVTNTGNVTLTKVMVSDPLTGLDQNAGTLAPGASTALNTEYVVTQADVDAGFVLNTALASGESPDGEDPEDETEIETPIDPLPSITLGKTVDVTSVSEAGVVLNYTLLVKNTGNVTLTSGELTDPKTGLAVGSLTLAPGEERSFQTTYTVTLEDILSGEPILNVATVKAVHENSETPVEAEDDATVNVDLTAGIQIDKTADKTVVYEIGEVITYTITVTNTGTAPLVDVQVNDPMTGFTESVEMLLPNEVLEYSTTYTVTESDIANQENLVNVATVTATNPVDPENPVSEEDDHVVEVGCEGQTLITGIAFNAETDLPLAGVPITLIPQGDTPGSTLLVITGADGRYTFQDFAPGSYLVQVQDANLNAARGLYPVESSLFFTDIADCAYQTHDFGYETYDGIVLGDFVWYDLNGDGIQNEWFDANNDGQVTLNDPTQGPIDIADWEWFDLNGDGRYDGPENEGELNKAGFGNAQSANVHVDGPGGYAADIIVGIIGYWRDRPEGVEFGEFTAYLNNDEFLDAEAQRMGATGLVKVLPDASARMTDINASRTEVRCGVTGGADGITAQITAENPVNLDMDFGMRCLEVDVEIIANDDDFGTHFISFGGLLGNILDNDRLEGERPDPADVDFEFTELDGIVGLLIDENGELSLIPGVNEAREYTLRYTLREVAFPDNQDDALVVFRLMNDEVNLNITKTSFEQEIFVGDEFEYEIVLSNIGGTPATNVVVTDNLPNGVSYLSSEVTANSSGAEIATNEAGSQLSWTIPFLEADATVTIRVKVLAETAGAITNVVVVDSEEEDTDEADNQDDDVNTIKPFHIPNVITPNNDGDNDTFEIEGINIFQSTEITIINRFGDHVLEQENYQNDWDAPGQTAGTYYYVLKAIDRSGQEHEYKGWIQVIKD